MITTRTIGSSIDCITDHLLFGQLSVQLRNLSFAKIYADESVERHRVLASQNKRFQGHQGAQTGKSIFVASRRKADVRSLIGGQSQYDFEQRERERARQSKSVGVNPTCERELALSFEWRVRSDEPLPDWCDCPETRDRPDLPTIVGASGVWRRLLCASGRAQLRSESPRLPFGDRRKFSYDN